MSRSLKCNNGWIDGVYLTDEFLNTRLNSRGCGLAYDFTELCLVDPQVNRMPAWKVNKKIEGDEKKIINTV